jgi:hypothetical protein
VTAGSSVSPKILSHIFPKKSRISLRFDIVPDGEVCGQVVRGALALFVSTHVLWR